MIGGGGEKKTLRLVAQYADACNVFGSPEMIACKYRILDDHCAAVGRDPSEIERSTLQGVNLATDGGRRGETAAQVVDRFGDLADAGAEHVIVSVPGVHDAARIQALAEVIPALQALQIRRRKPAAYSRGYGKGATISGMKDNEPFGGLAIDFGGDGTTGPAAPIAIAPDAPATATGGPATVASGDGRVDTKLLIIGSGPAGLTAAVYAARPASSRSCWPAPRPAAS